MVLSTLASVTLASAICDVWAGTIVRAPIAVFRQLTSSITELAYSGIELV